MGELLKRVGLISTQFFSDTLKREFEGGGWDSKQQAEAAATQVQEKKEVPAWTQ